MLKHENGVVREETISVLGNIEANPEIVVALRKCTEDEEENVSQAAVNALQNLGEKVVLKPRGRKRLNSSSIHQFSSDSENIDALPPPAPPLENLLSGTWNPIESAPLTI